MGLPKQAMGPFFTDETEPTLRNAAREFVLACRMIEHYERGLRGGKSPRASSFETSWSRLVRARKRVEDLLEKETGR